MNCPYCGNPAQYGPNELFYGKRYGESYMAYFCKPCGAYVGTHKNSKTPLGTMANEELRTWRKKAHKKLDPLWKSGKLHRDSVYAFLNMTLGYEVHIGQSDIDQCKKIIEVLDKLDKLVV